MTAYSRPTTLACLTIVALAVVFHADRAAAEGTAAKPRSDAAGAPDSLARRQVTEATIPIEMAPAAPTAATQETEEQPCPPPRHYALSEVTIECEQQRPRDRGYSIQVTGVGSGTRKRWHPHSQDTQRFFVAPEAVFQLLKAAYHLRFFELHANYSRPPWPSIDLHGNIQTLATIHSTPFPSRSATVRIGDCTKTVSWSLDPESPPPTEAAFLASALDSLCAMALKAASNPDSLDPVWTPWEYSAMLGAIPLEDRTWWERSGVVWPAKLDSVRLLAWYSTKGGSNALLWYRLIDAKGEPAWVLEQAFQNGLRGWQPTNVADAPWSPIRVFKHRPTNADVYALLDPPSSWQFDSTGGFPIESGYVREYTWKAVIGQAPTRRYHRGK